MLLLHENMHALLTESILQTLRDAGIANVPDFVNADKKLLVQLTDIPATDIIKIRAHLINKHSAVVQTGLEMYKQLLQNSALISTGLASLDKYLGGGLMTGNVYEICGYPASGKTRLCISILKNYIKTLHQEAYYLDGKRSLSGKKLISLLESDGCNDNQIAAYLSKILVKQLYCPYELINSLYQIKKQIEEGLKLRLIIINSLPTFFYGRETSERKDSLLSVLRNVMFLLAKEFHLVFLVVNLLTSWYHGGFETSSPGMEIVSLGKSWKETPNLRLKISQADELYEYRVVVLNKCHSLPTITKGKSNGDDFCTIVLR